MKKTLASIMIVLLFFSLSACEIKTTEFDSIDHYGEIVGNNEGITYPQTVFESLFPAKIEPFFEEPQYHYKAIRGSDSWDFEIALEFCVQDEATYWDYVLSVAPIGEFFPFSYQTGWLMYSPKPPYLHLATKKPCDECGELVPDEHYHIDEADIQMILLEPDEHRLLFLAMGVLDGGGRNTFDLSYLFDRFHINPRQFADDNPYQKSS